MKKVFYKIFAATIAVLSISILSITSFIGVAAEEAVISTSSQIVVTTDNNETITPRGDTIIVKYRQVNGKWQYRRWNETQQKWVDSDWIDM